MKLIAFITFAWVVIHSCSTTTAIKATPEMLHFEKIINVLNTPKDELYIKVNSWFVETFTSAESVIEFQDKEAGRVMGKYIFDYYNVHKLT